MGNQQQGGTSHHFLNGSPTELDQGQKRGSLLWTKNGRIPLSKQAGKPTWQLARDASMEILSRKATKLNFKQGPTPNLIGNRRFTLKKYPQQPTAVPGKPLPIYRVPRMPNEKEIADVIIAYQLLCEFCSGPCIGDYLRCRVCIRTYHSQCLYERGHVNDPSFSLPRLARQDWSCPDCGDLTRLLTEDQINYLIHVFDQIDRNKDGYIIMENFLELCSGGKVTDNFNLFNQKEELEKHHFILMDLKEKGVVGWSDFALFYSCKLIAAKNKTFLTTKLSTKELVFARNLFLKDSRLKIDQESNIIVTKDHFNRVYYDLTLMIKKKYGGHYIDAILHENQPDDETIEKLSVIGWDEFLRQIAVPIILNRSNYDLKKSQVRRGSIVPHVSKTNVISHVNLTANNTTTVANVVRASVTISTDFSADELFRKHGQMLRKLNARERQEELRRKQMGSIVNWSIVESVDEEENLETPKLKPNARDERQTISEPWTMVKDMQQLRNQPLLITTTRYQMLKV